MKKIWRITLLVVIVCVTTYGLAKPPLWTEQGCRFELISDLPGKNLNWVFLPGGPGLGSEYIRSFVVDMKLPGNTWILDMPGDGSNRLQNKKINYNQWTDNVVEAVSSLDNVVLVTHSFSGMLALSTPALQQHLAGLVLLDTAPNNEWQIEALKKFPKALVQAVKTYDNNHTDANLKQIALAMGPLFFAPDQMEIGKKLLKDLPYNHYANDWADEVFNPHYAAKWVPKNIPTLIVSGEDDVLTPINLFQKNKEFNQLKIIIIPRAGHFSWINHELEFRKIFDDYAKNI